VITAVDTNILLDILVADKKHFEDSKSLLDRHMAEGQLILCEVVCAELASQFSSEQTLPFFIQYVNKIGFLQRKSACACRGEMDRLRKAKEKGITVYLLRKIYHGAMQELQYDYFTKATHGQ
jgi:hypothetical protein